MTAWVETQVPCMLYCGPDLCNCSARWFYEELEEGDYDYEEYEESLTQDKKEQQLNQVYNKYLAKLRAYNSNVPQEVGVAKSKVTCTLPDGTILSA